MSATLPPQNPPAYRAATGPAVISAPREVALKRISWPAVFAGVILAMVIQLLLTLLGAAVGLGTLDPMQANGTPEASTFGTSAGLWWVASSLISLFIAGSVASHLADVPTKVDGMLHGLLAWGLATLIATWLVTSTLGAVVAGTGRLVGGVVSTAATGVATVAAPAATAAAQSVMGGGNPPSMNDVSAAARELLAQTGKPELQPGALEGQARAAAGDAQNTAANAGANPQGATAGGSDADFSALIQRLMSRGDAVLNEVDREAVVNVIVARTGVSRDEANRRVDAWMGTMQAARARADQFATQAKQQATQAADTAARVGSQAAMWAFFALLLGAVSSALGGLAGRPKRTVVTA